MSGKAEGPGGFSAPGQFPGASAGYNPTIGMGGGPANFSYGQSPGYQPNIGMGGGAVQNMGPGAFQPLGPGSSPGFGSVYGGFSVPNGQPGTMPGVQPPQGFGGGFAEASAGGAPVGGYQYPPQQQPNPYAYINWDQLNGRR